MINKLAERGVKVIIILTGSDNDPAIKIYEHCGYVKDDEIFLQKEL